MTGSPSSTARPPRPSTRRCSPAAASTGGARSTGTAAGRLQRSTAPTGWPAELGPNSAARPRRGRHDAPLPGADRLRPAPGQRPQHRPGAALVRRVPGSRPHPMSPACRQVTRRHIEDYKPWLAARPGQNKPELTTATLAHRLGTLRMFFVRHRRMGLGRSPGPGADVPRRPAPPRPPAAQGPRRRRRREAAARRPERPAAARPRHRRSAAAHRAAGQRVHRPARRRRRADRRRAAGCTSRSASSARTATCPCTPSWSSLIDDYRSAHVPPDHPLLLPRENGRPLDRHAVTRMINKAAATPGCPTSTPTSCATPWPPRRK